MKYEAERAAKSSRAEKGLLTIGSLIQRMARLNRKLHKGCLSTIVSINLAYSQSATE